MITAGISSVNLKQACVCNAIISRGGSGINFKEMCEKYIIFIISVF